MLEKILRAVDRDVGRPLEDEPLHVDGERALADQARELDARLTVAARLDRDEFAFNPDGGEALLHVARPGRAPTATVGSRGAAVIDQRGRASPR